MNLLLKYYVLYEKQQNNKLISNTSANFDIQKFSIFLKTSVTFFKTYRNEFSINISSIIYSMRNNRKTDEFKAHLPTRCKKQNVF